MFRHGTVIDINQPDMRYWLIEHADSFEVRMFNATTDEIPAVSTAYPFERHGSRIDAYREAARQFVNLLNGMIDAIPETTKLGFDSFTLIVHDDIEQVEPSEGDNQYAVKGRDIREMGDALIAQVVAEGTYDIEELIEQGYMSSIANLAESGLDKRKNVILVLGIIDEAQV